MGDEFSPLNDAQDAPLPMRMQEGDEVGNYLVLAHLFTGGMGDIFAAVHLKLNRHVALKVPRLDSAAAQFNRRRLLSEAQFLARVAHVNVVAVYDFAATGDQLEYLVMELLDGRSLDEILFKTPQLEISHAIRIVKEIARGLGAFHRAGIYHVDVKPENVMIVTGPLVNKPLEGENWVKLIDLGTARLSYEHADDSELPLVGTPAYMAPESILDRPVDNRADLYAMGIVFFEILAGRHPLSATDDADMLQAQVARRPPPISVHRPDIPAGSALEQLIADCLQKRPERRPKSIIEFLGRLDQAVSEWRKHVAQSSTVMPGGHI